MVLRRFMLYRKSILSVSLKKKNLTLPLPGEAMSLKAFQNWIHASEDSTNITLREAKAKWANKRKQLQKLTL